MNYMIDTNAWIELLRARQPGPLMARFARLRRGDAALNAVVRAELIHGAMRSANPERARKRVDELLALYESLPFDDDAAEHYALIRKALETTGRTIGGNDLMIAAVARSRNLTLVTHNVGEFSRVPDLRWEDWQIPE